MPFHSGWAMATKAPASAQRRAIAGALSLSSVAMKSCCVDGAKLGGRPTARMCQISPFFIAPVCISAPRMVVKQLVRWPVVSVTG